jgi:hypothetical protein
MKRNLLQIALFTFAWIPLAFAVDLTPQVEEYVGEGILYHKIVFRQATRSIVMELPNQWTCSGGKDRVRLVPPAAHQYAEGVIAAVPLSKPQPLDEALTAAFKQQVLASLPFGSQAVTVVAEVENSLRLGDNPGYELLVSYKLLGRTFRRSAILVHLPETRLTFHFTATDSEFVALAANFRRAVIGADWPEPPTPNAIVAQNN